MAIPGLSDRPKSTHFSERSGTRVLSFLLVLVVFVLLGINVFVQSQSREYIFKAPTVSDPPVIDLAEAEIPTAKVAILLGASVRESGELAPILEDRVKTAIFLYKTGHTKKILVTGDGSSKYYNEVEPIQKYLLEHGVSASDIILDNLGLDTFDSMYRAKNNFEVSSALVVSQRFHLSRAVYIARKLGIDAYGVSADLHPYGFKNDFRELFATVKSFWEVGVNW